MQRQAKGKRQGLLWREGRVGGKIKLNVVDKIQVSLVAQRLKSLPAVQDTRV